MQETRGKLSLAPLDPSVREESEIELSLLDSRDEGIPFVTGVELRCLARILGVADSNTFGPNGDRHAGLGVVLGPTRLEEIPIIDWENHPFLVVRGRASHS